MYLMDRPFPFVYVLLLNVHAIDRHVVVFSTQFIVTFFEWDTVQIKHDLT